MERVVTLAACGLAALALTGEVQFDDRRVAHVSSQAGGIIQKVHVTLGDKVKRGQLYLNVCVWTGCSRLTCQSAAGCTSSHGWSFFLLWMKAKSAPFIIT